MPAGSCRPAWVRHTATRRSALPDSTPPPRTVASRLTAILLTFRSGSSHSLTEIAQLTGLPMSTVHRLATEMASWQLLTRTDDGRYEIGSNLPPNPRGGRRAPEPDEPARRRAARLL